MSIGVTLGKSLRELEQMGQEEIAWWIAYHKVKEDLEARERKKRQRRGRR